VRFSDVKVFTPEEMKFKILIKSKRPELKSLTLETNDNSNEPAVSNQLLTADESSSEEDEMDIIVTRETIEQHQQQVDNTQPKEPKKKERKKEG